MRKDDLNKMLSLVDDKYLDEASLEYVYNSCDPEFNEKYDLRPAVGLAAPQIGILKKMIAIVAPDEKGNEHEFAIINPKLISYSDELTYLPGGEGCLSVDRSCDAYIHRPARVTFEAYIYNFETRQVEKKRIRLKGYLAVVFQHEYDHLEGHTFIDRINPIRRQMIRGKLNSIIKGKIACRYKIKTA